MKILGYQAASFRWEPFSQTLENAAPAEAGKVEDAAVFWLHIEQGDVANRQRVFKHTLKYMQWLANKRSLGKIVLHSFAHLGGETAPAEFAQQFLDELAERLSARYSVQQTPFGWFCSWELKVYGDSMAKVFKSI